LESKKKRSRFIRSQKELRGRQVLKGKKADRLTLPLGQDKGSSIEGQTGEKKLKERNGGTA